MRKIIDYRLFQFSYPDPSIDKFLRYLKDGWQPYGDAFSKDSCIVQPIVKYEDTEEREMMPRPGRLRIQDLPTDMPESPF